MKLIYKGKFDGNVENLPAREHMPNAVKFKEADDPKKLGIIANSVSFAIIIVLFVLYFLRFYFSEVKIENFFIQFVCGGILPMAILFPHELLHAICFKKEVYLYTNLKNGMLFVVGPETMSKGRFIFMSLLPNIIFGFIPYIIGMIFPNFLALAIFGAVSISSGAGDYNVFNALTQMPKGARTYLYQFNSYWYMP